MQESIPLPTSPKGRRDFLKQVSQKLKPHVESGRFGSINEAIIAVYRQELGVHSLQSFSSWKKKGFKIRKGEHGYPIWSKPIQRESKQQEQSDQTSETQATSDKTYTFFGMCYLFTEHQVEQAAAPAENR